MKCEISRSRESRIRSLNFGNTSETEGFGEDPERLGLVFANPIAYAHMLKLKREAKQGGYPDGAAFGRLLYKAERDPRLRAARVPGSAREFQLMVRGASRFNAEGKSLNEEPQAMAASSVACHSLAEKDGFTFSKLAPMSVNLQMKHKD